MLPFGNELITLIRRTETTDSLGKHHALYTKLFLRGCSWRRTAVQNAGSGTITYSEQTTCKVPKGQPEPHAGDLMIHGTYSGTIDTATDYQKAIEATRADKGSFVVQSVGDYTMTDTPFPHYTATEYSQVPRNALTV